MRARMWSRERVLGGHVIAHMYFLLFSSLLCFSFVFWLVSFCLRMSHGVSLALLAVCPPPHRSSVFPVLLSSFLLSTS